MTTTTPPSSTAPQAAPKRRKRIFMWTFLAIQALFVLWLVVGLATAHTTPDAASVASGCLHGAWQGLFKSQHDCMVHYASGLKQAGEAGTAIGAGIIVALWVALDVILGIGRLVVVFARRGGAHA